MSISKALLIGINYNNSSNKLNGCYNDVIDMAHFIEQQYGVQELMILTDEKQQYNTPTKKHIIQSINWLVNGVKKGDCLFFHYSGHGSQIKTTDIHEDDYLDETICPIDFEENGMICDGELRYYLVDPLPEGSKLTCILDCCHSGTGLDLKYNLEYDELNTSNKINDNELSRPLCDKLIKLHEYYLKDNGYKDSNCDALMISGCTSTQTSTDAVIDNRNRGAMTFAFLEALKNIKDPSYVVLLNTMWNILHSGKYEQKPQFHFSKNIDVRDSFKPNEPTKYNFPSLNHEIPKEVEMINHEFNDKHKKNNIKPMTLKPQLPQQPQIQQYNQQPQIQQYNQQPQYNQQNKPQQQIQQPNNTDEQPYYYYKPQSKVKYYYRIKTYDNNNNNDPKYVSSTPVRKYYSPNIKNDERNLKIGYNEKTGKYYYI